LGGSYCVFCCDEFDIIVCSSISVLSSMALKFVVFWLFGISLGSYFTSLLDLVKRDDGALPLLTSSHIQYEIIVSVESGFTLAEF
jgi:hypothetical protein